MTEEWVASWLSMCCNMPWVAYHADLRAAVQMQDADAYLTVYIEFKLLMHVCPKLIINFPIKYFAKLGRHKNEQNLNTSQIPTYHIQCDQLQLGIL